MHRRLLAFLTVLTALTGLMAARPAPTEASHSWNGYHWARTANPFALKLGDNVGSVWDPILATTSSDWSQSTVLDTTIVAGGGGNGCRATSGRVEVCSRRYGFNGWLGIATIWPDANGHIYQATVKVNDSYFNTATYNSTAWRNLVMCQEVGHTFGLDHQDENFNNPPLGTCMDYSSDPTPNQHPNAHDYEELEIIHSHLDSTTTVRQTPPGPGQGAAPGSPFDDEGPNDPPQFGRPVGPRDSFGRSILFVRDASAGRQLFTWVFWAHPGQPGAPTR